MVDITINFDDGKQHVYQNAPDNLTPDDVYKRASEDFPNQKIVGLSKESKSDDSFLGSLKATGKSLAEQAVPFASAIPGAEAGSALGAAIGGPFAPITSPIGGLIGGGLGYYLGEKGQEKAASYVPQSIKEATGFTEEQREKEKEEHPVATGVAEYGPLAVGLGLGGYDIAKGIYKVAGPTIEKNVEPIISKAKNFISSYKGEETSKALDNLANKLKSGEIEKEVLPESGVTDKDIEQVNRLIENAPINYNTGAQAMEDINNVNKLFAKKRADLAEKTYGKAKESMNEKHDSGNFFQTSESGSKFIDKLESKKSLEKGTQISQAEEADIDKILSDIKGKIKTTPESVVSDPLSVSGPKKIPAKTEIAYSRPNVIIETLRRLRDRANGAIQTGYDAISQQRAGKLANDLSEAIEGWDSNLKKADEQYKSDSELLHPGMTARGKKVLGKEKFDLTQLKNDPVNVMKTFFNSRQGVEQFSDLIGGNQDKLERYAIDHLNNLMKDAKTFEAKQNILRKAENEGWLNDSILPRTKRIIDAQMKVLAHDEARKPIMKVLNNFENGIIKSEDLPKELKQAFKNTDLPSESVKKLVNELDKIQILQNDTEKAKALAKKIAAWAGVTALTGEGINYLSGR